MMNKVNLRNSHWGCEGKVSSDVKKKFRVNQLPPHAGGVGVVVRQWSFRFLVPVGTNNGRDTMFLHLLVLQCNRVKEIEQSSTALNTY
jgi:hypothetical protein